MLAGLCLSAFGVNNIFFKQIQPCDCMPLSESRLDPAHDTHVAQRLIVYCACVWRISAMRMKHSAYAVTTSHDFVRTEQLEPYGDIALSRGAAM